MFDYNWKTFFDRSKNLEELTSKKCKNSLFIFIHTWFILQSWQ